MGYFFENMEKMDIQEERRLRKEAQREAQRQAQREAQRAYIEALQEVSLDRAEAKNKFMIKFALDEEQAEERMKSYWK